jgi:hypothetical protein
MLNVEITYAGLIRSAVRRRREHLEIARGATLGQLLEEVVRRHGPAARPYLLDDDVDLLPHAIISVNGTGVRDMAAPLGGESATVQILVLSPMMIGG